jgi:hypothetical protein
MTEVTRERLEAALRELVVKWHKPHGDCKEDNHEYDCFCSVYDDCAEELEAALAASVAELDAVSAHDDRKCCPE